MSDPNAEAKDATTFIGWEPGSDEVPRKHAPRLYHKKSRAGCQQCRSRRVKCNEVHPVCGNCERHQTTCIWGRDQSATRPDEPQIGASKEFDIRPKVRAPVTVAALEIPESRERRLTELHLLHHYQTATSYTLNKPDPKQVLWTVSIPHLAFKHDSLLYSIYTITALHLAHEEPHEPKHAENHQKYLALTLSLHRDDVATLRKENVDAATMTSALLRVYSFGVLQRRSLDPYSPPIEWLRMNNGTGRGLHVAAQNFTMNDPTSLTRAILENTPGIDQNLRSLIDRKAMFNEKNRVNFQHLLRRTPENGASERWSKDIEIGYTEAVSYIGLVTQAIASEEQESGIFRRLVIFPMLVYPDFVIAVEECQPRALVMLAHFFALLTRMQEFWWVGKTGTREVLAIQQYLGEEWQDLMEWPLQVINQANINDNE